MKKMALLFLMGSILLLSSTSFALTINFATGQDGNGLIQTIGNSKDANWTATGPIATYVTTSSNADWYSNWGQITSPNSSWIAPYPNSDRGNGSYNYTYTFDLSGYSLASAVFSGMQFAIDDGGSVQLNGNTIASNIWYGGGNYYFTALTVPTGYLLNGVNTLTVIQSPSTDNYLEAMRFEGTLTVSPVPLPPGLLLLGPGLFGLAAIRRKFAR